MPLPITEGSVEFWSHGWDHKRWTTEDGRERRQFSGTGYKHQKTHFEQSQALMKKMLGTAPVAFGSPYNPMDTNTVKVMTEDPEIQLYFGYGKDKVPGKLLAPMLLKGEGGWHRQAKL
ncbi:MAG TPA: hypothetical protein DCS43_08125 [Verrucomicrobia bacterium]|nr:hypothetical protein [Verrucomicrobiota bacterium]